MTELWIMLPARGGSRGVPRKNLRLLSGIPLIVHAIRLARSQCDESHVLVITDDDEIADVASHEGARVLREAPTTGRATLDEVALAVGRTIAREGAGDDDIFLTLQPTCPLLRPQRLDEARALFEAGAGCVLTVVDDRRLRWRLGDNGQPEKDYEARLNRQQLPTVFRESGAIIGCRLGDLLSRGTRIVEPVSLIEVGADEGLDIDDFNDWAVAEHLVSRRRIVIRADAGEAIGMGHVYRALAVAQEFARHDVLLVTDVAMPLGHAFLARYPFALAQIDGDDAFIELVRDRTPDLVILDRLDTDADHVRALKAHAARVVSFEDLGSGAREVDLLVSDLYENPDVPPERQLAGIANAILAPSFETAGWPAPWRDKVDDILILFGGTDPSHLTEKALEALALSGFSGRAIVVRGPGMQRPVSLADHGLAGEVLTDVGHMAAVMRGVDLAISSAGRTVTELVSLGVPVLCLCQNEKELTHTHASVRHGVVNLGLGALVGCDTVAAHIRHLVDSVELRRTLRGRALEVSAGRSNAAVIRRIMQRIGWD